MKRCTALLPLLLLSALLPLLGAAPASAATTSGQSLYVPVEPVRLLDTRSGAGTPLGAGRSRDLRVADGSPVPTDATAVVLTVTATRPTRSSDVRVYPTPSGDTPPPKVSNLNVVAGTTVANLVTVGVGEGGRVRLLNANGSLHLVVDLAGYFTTAGGSTLVARAPTRLLDTRVTGGALRGGEVRRLRVVGPGGVPQGTSAVALNVTGVGATTQTDVRVYPTRAGAPPRVSHLNPAPGRTTAAAVVVRVGDDGTISLRNNSGSVHLVVDLNGSYVPGDRFSVFHPLAPARLLDTRGSAPLGPGGIRDVVVAGVGRVPAPGTAVALNVTATAPTSSSDLRVYPTPVDARVPGTSNLNVVRGQTVANAVLATVGRDGAVRVRNNSGSVHLVVDLAGWFGPSGDGWDISWPQCTAAGSTTSRLPVGGAFAVIGLTRGRPFTVNECFGAQFAWADSLPGEPAVYINLNAPGPRSSVDGRQWEAVCGTGQATTTCGRAYGVALARHALPRLPRVSGSGRPMVWMDVEGPFAEGPFWQGGYPDAIAVNRSVLDGAMATVRAAGYRVGIYSDRGTNPANDWRAIMGDYRLPTVQNWVFRSLNPDGHFLCTPANSFSGGPVVMVQVQPAQTGEAFDRAHLC